MKKTLPDFIVPFGVNHAEVEGVSTLGQKGHAVASLSAMGLQVPPGFVLTVDACRQLALGDAETIKKIRDQFENSLAVLSDETGFHLGDPRRLLLLSVRPSTPASMLGGLESILNLGLNDETVEGLAKTSSDAGFAHECYRRLIQNYAHVVTGDDPAAFEDLLALYIEERGYVSSTEIKPSDGREITARFKAQVEAHDGQSFPQDPVAQVWNAILALVRGWKGPRAQAQRKLHGVAADAGLAVVVQAMVFGNQTENSGAGTAVSRNPATGEATVQGEFLLNAQGADLITRLRQSLPLQGAATSLQSLAPTAFEKLHDGLLRLEQQWRDAVQVDFTLSQGEVWFLDAKPQKRTTAAAIKIVVDLVALGHLSPDEALLRIDPLSLDQLLHSTLDPSAKRELVAAGVPASPGAASGMIAFDAEEAGIWALQGRSVILVRTETSPEDIRGLHMAAGVLTTRGGMTSHAAVIARGMGKPCVAGASSLKIDLAEGVLRAPGLTLKKGDVITLDGSAGQVLKGEVAVLKPSLTGDFGTLLGWADKAKRMAVRANVETPHEARIARDFGAEGIGLSRTEHMFFEGDRIVAMREMILADGEKERRVALAKLQPMLKADLVALFEIMAGYPVCIRLLDPPLHEFLPSRPEEIEAVAKALGREPAMLKRRLSELREENPMLGHRGVRLLLTYPEITDMQTRAIFEAAIEASQITGKMPIAEIMVPLVASRAELAAVRQRIDAVAQELRQEQPHAFSYLVGTMIELPRAALRAEDIAKAADFFSFGTNDLTQTTYGISRDDSARFLSEYAARGIFPRDPFGTLDLEGVGELIGLAVERGKKGRPSLHLGICGEHGGEPESIAFFEEKGLDYVSCSPYRVPVARLAAARAHLKNKIKLF